MEENRDFTQPVFFYSCCHEVYPFFKNLVGNQGILSHEDQGAFAECAAGDARGTGRLVCGAAQQEGAGGQTGKVSVRGHTGTVSAPCAPPALPAAEGLSGAGMGTASAVGSELSCPVGDRTTGRG